jgi:hypothetical protein
MRLTSDVDVDATRPAVMARRRGLWYRQQCGRDGPDCGEVAMKFTHIDRAIAATAIVGTLAASAWLGTAIGHAAPAGVDAYAYESTVELTDIPNIDALAVCELEDGSDAASYPCIWGNEGNAWLTYPDRSLLIVDNTGDGRVTDIELGA